jgi:hypothetical protein
MSNSSIYNFRFRRHHQLTLLMRLIYQLLRLGLARARRFRSAKLYFILSVICTLSATVIIIWKLHLLNIVGTLIRSCVPSEYGIQSKLNIGIVTFHFDSSNSSAADIDSKARVTGPFTKRNHAAYATYQVYKLIREDNFSINPNLGQFGSVWAKVDVLKKHLNNFDWLVWIDSDLLIMNFKRRLETFIPRNSDIDIVITSDKGGLNAGIFLWRNSSSGHEILNRWANLASSNTDEQKQLASLIRTEATIARRTRILPLCAFNSYLTANHLTTRYEYGDFAVHFAGSAWALQKYVRTEYGWNLFAYFSDLAGDDGVTLKKWLGWRNVVKLLQLPWRP